MEHFRLRNRFAWQSPLFLALKCVIVDSYFVNYESMQEILYILLELVQHSLEMLCRMRFWFNVNKRDIHRAASFLIFKSSYNILNTRLEDISTSAISLTFSFRSSSTILCILSTISSVVIVYRQPGCSSSNTFVHGHA